jgi:NAD dependent epimerase/dehydratase family enzyme
MFSARAGSMLGRMIALLLKIPVLPVPSPPPRRSMITFEDAAQVIERIVESGVSGAVNAADPQPFTYALLSQVLQEGAGRGLILPRFPAPAFGLLGYLVPAAQQSLFSSNVLEPEANMVREGELSVGLDAGLRQLVQEMVASRWRAPRS